MIKATLIRILLWALVSTGGLVAVHAAAAKAPPLTVQAAKLALAGNFMDAGAAAKRSEDEAAVKLVELLYLRDHSEEAGYARIMAFLNAAPKWPLAEILLTRAERLLYNNRESSQVILAHFAKRQPLTPEGALALARAKLASGDKAGAAKLVSSVWSNPLLDPELEKPIASEFKSFLSLEDHQRRMWRLVYAHETNAALRMSKRLSGSHQNAAKVAQALLRGVGGADKQYTKLPAAMREQSAMKYSLVVFLRKREAYSKARAILVGIPAATGDAEAWWVERRIVARHSIGIKRKDSFKAAYQLARSHGLASGDGAIEGEFLAGWIALRQLKEPEKALSHFQKLGNLAHTETEKARAGYWTGRTLSALDRAGEAKDAYRDAAQYSTVYYGQLAREKIGLGKVPEKIPSGEPSAEARSKIAHDEVARAFQMVAEAGGQGDLNMFLWSFASRFNNSDEMNAAADLVWSKGGATMALRLAKAAAPRNIDIDSWSYPVNALPGWKQVGKPVEKALIFGLSRQESEFNPTVGSKAGAQGLMQIMPGTAVLIAKRHKLSYKKGSLTADPSYNVKLGAAHLGDLIDDFGGSYVLTLVAYNAGPGRSYEWMAEYGDLRRGVDPVDWVESIPFQETRQYVQKVLQNVHMYRSRLAPDTVRPLTADLARGSRKKVEIADNTPLVKPASCDGGSIADLISTCQ
ncbi:MAG TPA: lytic transglycosylase domain-containing protein [Aestuariivirga sp.]|nr:lytic transglycosylase domain-containing protein [Aestuariivirga sp.]